MIAYDEDHRLHHTTIDLQSKAKVDKKETIKHTNCFLFLIY